VGHDRVEAGGLDAPDAAGHDVAQVDGLGDHRQAHVGQEGNEYEAPDLLDSVVVGLVGALADQDLTEDTHGEQGEQEVGGQADRSVVADDDGVLDGQEDVGTAPDVGEHLCGDDGANPAGDEVDAGRDEAGQPCPRVKQVAA